MKASDIVKIAEAEFGYIGKRSNKSLDDPTDNTAGKYTKYARDLFEAGYYNGNKNGYDWCCVFVDWLFWTAAGCNKSVADKTKPVSIYGAGVNYVKGMFPASQIGDIPYVGAQVLFKDSSGLCHTGIVVDVNGDTFDTIEGNLTGYKVGRKTYKITDGYIDSFVYPYYECEDSTVVTIPESEYLDFCVKAHTLDELIDAIRAIKEML